jgi:DNA-binding transcriptional LysR family regulator
VVATNLNDILTYVTIVEKGTFTAAGAALQLPKSSVSRRLTRLEERLGVRLMQRTTRSLTMTEAGRTYFEKARRALDDLADLELKVSDMGEAPQGPLRVTVPVSFLEMGGDFFFRFCDRYPKVRLELEVTDRLVDLVREGFDVALRGGRPPDRSLTGLPVFSSSLQILAAPDYLKGRVAIETPTDLQAHECLCHGLRGLAVWAFEGPGGRQEVTVGGRLASTSLLFLLRAAKRGYGVARLPTGGGGYDLRGLEVLLRPWSSPGGGLWLVYPSAKHLPPAVRAFIEFAQDPGNWPQ